MEPSQERFLAGHDRLKKDCLSGRKPKRQLKYLSNVIFNFLTILTLSKIRAAMLSET
jgi:hypothetical protein